MEFIPSGRRAPAPGETGVVLLRVPPELKRQLAQAARERRTSTNKIVVETLTKRLGAPTPRKDTMARNGSQNGKARSKDKVRVAIIGVGNCANSLLQGVEYYKDASPDDFVPGLMHVDLGGYHVRDVEFTAAFDVTTTKVGKDLADAIWASRTTRSSSRTSRRPASRLARNDARRARQVHLRGRQKAPGDTDDVVASSRRPARTSSSTTSRSAPRKRRSGTPSKS